MNGTPTPATPQQVPLAQTLLLGSLAGLASALLVLTVASGPFGLLLGYLAPLPLFFVGLTKGIGAVAIAALVGTLVSGIYDWLTGLCFALLFGIPALVLVRQALLARPMEEAGNAVQDGRDAEHGLEWYPAGRLVLWLAGLALALLALAYIFTAGSEGGLTGLLEPILARLFQRFPAEMIGGADPNILAARAARMMPAVMLMSWMAMLSINGTLAQGLARLVKQNKRPAPRYSAMELPAALVYAGVALAIVAYVASSDLRMLAGTVAVVLAYPIFLQGLAVVHVLAAKSSFPGVILAAFYAVMVVAGSLGGVLLILVVILGLIEQWAGIRRRVAGAGASQENV